MAETEVCHEYFYTVGSGLENFCEKELLELSSTQVLDTTVGKVFFSSSLPARALLTLKTVERLFILVHKEPQFLLSHSKRESIKRLRVLVEENRFCGKWKSCLMKWREFQASNEGNCSNYEELSFRVSCKCSGRIKNAFSPAFLGKILAGSLLNAHEKWTTNLRNPQLEVLAHVNPETLIIGLACCPMNAPLSKRYYLQNLKRHTLLRPTVSFAMLVAALPSYERNKCEDLNGLCKREIKIDNKRNPLVILDPMCGTGIILAEAAAWLDFKCGLILLGGDSDVSQLREASSNITCALNKHSAMLPSSTQQRAQHSDRCTSNLFMADARALPLKDSSVDIIITDMPFGLKHRGKPWKKDLSHSAGVKRHLVGDEFCTTNQPRSLKRKCFKTITDGDSRASSNEISEIQEPDSRKSFETESLFGVRLDTAVIVGDSTTAKHYSKALLVGKGNETPTENSSERKLEHVGAINDPTGVDNVRDMLPLVVREMDRVLVEGGQAVLLISESLRLSLLETVSIVTNSKYSFKYFGQNSHLHNLEKNSATSSTGIGNSYLDNLNINELGNHEKTFSREESWICSGQHKVKLGVLDAVICIFIK